jgi:hypothetical protein
MIYFASAFSPITVGDANLLRTAVGDANLLRTAPHSWHLQFDRRPAPSLERLPQQLLSALPANSKSEPAPENATAVKYQESVQNNKEYVAMPMEQ